MAKKDNLLLIDDEAEILERLQKNLTKADYGVETCSSAAEAKLKLKENSYTAVLSDINMPECSGIDLLKWTQEEKIETKVILITGMADEVDARECIDLGCFSFLAKPISKDDLLSIVKSACSSEDEEFKETHFARIQLAEFMSGQKVEFPLYLKLGKGRYLKVSHEGSSIDLERLKRFEQNEVRELWVKKEDIHKYYEFCNRVVEITKVKAGWSPERKTAIYHHLCEVSYEELRLLGLDDEKIQVSADNLNIAINSLAETNVNQRVIEVLQGMDSSIYRRSVLAADLCGLMAQVMGWRSEKNRNILVLGAYLMDIGISKLPAIIQNTPFDKLDEDQLKTYQTHPEVGAQMLKDDTSLPDEIIKIVMQHHENGTEQAYPKKLLRHEVFPLAKIVNTVDRFLNRMLELKPAERSNPKEIETIFAHIKAKSLDKHTYIALKAVMQFDSMFKAREHYNKETLSIGTVVAAKKKSA